MNVYCSFCQKGMLCDRHRRLMDRRDAERKAQLKAAELARTAAAKRAAVRYKRENEGVEIPDDPFRGRDISTAVASILSDIPDVSTPDTSSSFDSGGGDFGGGGASGEF